MFSSTEDQEMKLSPTDILDAQTNWDIPVNLKFENSELVPGGQHCVDNGFGVYGTGYYKSEVYG